MAAIPAGRCPHCLGILPVRIGGEEPATTCPFCQREIILDQTADPRAAAESMRARLESQQAAHREREQWREQQREERAASEQRFHRELIELNVLSAADSSAVVLVPSYDGQITALPEGRKQKFLERLTRITEQLFNETGDDRGSYVLYDEAAPTAPPDRLRDQVPIAACTLCRGWCCTGGGEHAFLDRDSLKYRSEQHGYASAEEMVAACRDWLPEATNDGSCVFHTEGGCNLPRQMRSFTCNSFLCAGLDHFENHPPDGEVTEIAIVAQRNGERKRVAALGGEVPVERDEGD